MSIGNGTKRGWLDRVLTALAPETALRRERARAMIEALAQARRMRAMGYRGAERERRHATWLPAARSADADIMPQLALLRARSRDFIANDGYAAGLVQTIVANVIGTGITPQSRVSAGETGMNEDQAREYRAAQENAWREWSDRYADAGGRLDFYDLQRLAMRQVVENGEALAVFTWRDDAPSLQLIEADRLVAPRAGAGVASGVETDEFGRPKAYWIAYSHPGEGAGRAAQIERVEAEDERGRRRVLHLYRVERPGQTRGVPWLAPVLSVFRDMSEYIEAELVGARVAACYSIFIRTLDPLAAAQASADEGRRDALETLEPGLIQYLGPNEEIQSFSPNRPGGTFDTFVRRLLRALAAAVGLPYFVLAKDESDVNLSTARIARQESIRLWRIYQRWLARNFCQPAWDAAMEWAHVTGRVPRRADFYERRRAYTAAKWYGEGWPYMNPLEDVEAAKKAIDAGLTTLAEELGQRGMDFEETLAELGRERDALREGGVIDEAREAEIDAKLVKLGVPLPIEGFYRRYRRAAPRLAETPNGDGTNVVALEPAVRYDDNNIYRYHLEMGILTINEARATLGLPPVAWGDEPAGYGRAPRGGENESSGRDEEGRDANGAVQETTAERR